MAQDLGVMCRPTHGYDRRLMSDITHDPWPATVDALLRYPGDQASDIRPSLRESHFLVALVHEQRSRIEQQQERIDMLLARGAARPGQ